MHEITRRIPTISFAFVVACLGCNENARDVNPKFRVDLVRHVVIPAEILAGDIGDADRSTIRKLFSRTVRAMCFRF